MKTLTALIVLVGVLHASAQFKGLCYYTNWGVFRPEDIDPYLCTNIAYSFVHVENNIIVPFFHYDEDRYPRVLALKSQNPNLKVSLAVGGWVMGTSEMTKMLATAENRTEFVTTSIEYLRLHNMDGLELDFNYLGSRGSPPEDKQRFTQLVQELRAAFDQEASDTGQDVLLLSAAVACGSETIESGYEISLINQELDWIGLMSWDLSGEWKPLTSFNSPLRVVDPAAPTDYHELSMEWCVDRWLEGGATKDKLLAGQVSYGRCFTLADPNNNGLYAPAQVQSGNLSYCTIGGSSYGGPGIKAYFEVCEIFLDAGATVERPDSYEVPYAYLGDQWVGYDDPASAQAKAHYMKDIGLAGFMFYDLSKDDYAGQRCNEGTFPLLRATNVVLPPPTTPTTTTTVPPGCSTTTVPPDLDRLSHKYRSYMPVDRFVDTSSSASAVSCEGLPDNAQLPHPDCTKYYTCSFEVAYEMPCPPGLYFHPELKVCAYEYDLTEDRKYECCLTIPLAPFCCD